MLAIKLYSTMQSNDENILKGISGKIPALVVDLNTSPNYPTDETFTQMTQDEFNAYLLNIKPELDVWEQIQSVQ